MNGEHWLTGYGMHLVHGRQTKQTLISRSLVGSFISNHAYRPSLNGNFIEVTSLHFTKKTLDPNTLPLSTQTHNRQFPLGKDIAHYNNNQAKQL